MSSAPVMKRIRITVVGDGTTGKTCLLIVYKDGKYEEYYIPTVFDSYSMTVPIGNIEYVIILSDTAGQEEYDKLRPLAYPETDVFLICFAVNNRDSLANVQKKWHPEIRHYKPNAKIILVCTKIDLRKTVRNCITRAEGEEMRKIIKADRYVECSSKEMQNINRVFADAISSYFDTAEKKKSGLCALI